MYIFFYLFIPFCLQSFPLTNSLYSIEQDIFAGGGSTFSAKNAYYEVDHELVELAGLCDVSSGGIYSLAHGFMGNSLADPGITLRTFLDFPPDGAFLDEIRPFQGRSISSHPLQGVYVSLQRIGDNKYYSGQWQDTVHWFKAEGSDNWAFTPDQSAFTYNTAYKVSVKAVNIYGLAEGEPPYAGFVYVYSTELKNSFVNYPNPFTPGITDTRIEYFLSEPADVKVLIWDLSGRLVKQWKFKQDDNGGRPGVNYFEWDGRNSSGRLMSPGVYMCYLYRGKDTVLNKIMLER